MRIFHFSVSPVVLLAILRTHVEIHNPGMQMGSYLMNFQNSMLLTIEEGSLRVLRKLWLNPMAVCQAQRSSSSMPKPQGRGEDPIDVHTEDDVVSGDGVVKTPADVGRHVLGKDQPRDRPIVIHVPHKRKGQISKSQGSQGLMVDLNTSTGDGPSDMQLIQHSGQSSLVKEDLKI
jgi:hypothetical protein